MKVLDERVKAKAITFKDLQIGDVFEKSDSSDGAIWIKVFAEENSLGIEVHNAFRLSDNLVYIKNRLGYFNPDTAVRKLDTELVILGEAE